MEKNRRILIVIFLFGIMVPSFGTVLASNASVPPQISSPDDKNQDVYSSLYVDELQAENLGMIYFGTQDIRIDPLVLLIFGYSLQTEAENPISWDENAKIEIQTNVEKPTTVDIMVELKSGKYNFNSVSITQDRFVDYDSQILSKYVIEDYIKGFFMELDVYSEESHLNLAFDGGDKQLIYDGVNSLGLLNTNFNLSSEADGFLIKKLVSKINPRSEKSLEEFIQNKKKSLIDNFELLGPKSKINSKNGIIGPVSASWSDYSYGVIHNPRDDIDWVNDDAPSVMYESDHIDIVINRADVSESLMKSDLQYYNKDYYESEWTFRYKDILCYYVVAHGTDADSNWVITSLSKLKPSEVSDLWYTSGCYSSYPSRMIIFCTSCYGLIDYDMADAFVDDGADAFVGCLTLSTGGSISDLGYYYPNYNVHGFLIELCREGNTVYASRNARIAAGNTYYSTTYQAYHWPIVGSGSVYLY
ncbi:hypothetical protein [Candidatus Lokiarchaeum ossiferum]|uniref:hypothetical protein n=1 Tax=Candidatus Lokiarchaeum ossiferum TaxID=2951803 RepID=UPI00352E2504